MTQYDIILLLTIAITGSTLLFFAAKQKRKYVDVRDKKIMSIMRKDGHKIYELNCSTFDMTEIEAQEYSTEEGTFKRYEAKDNCLYCSALNEKNAIKQFNKMVPGTLVKE